MKSVLWRVAKRLSYIEDARCLKVNASESTPLSVFLGLPGFPLLFARPKSECPEL